MEGCRPMACRSARFFRALGHDRQKKSREFRVVPQGGRRTGSEPWLRKRFGVAGRVRVQFFHPLDDRVEGREVVAGYESARVEILRDPRVAPVDGNGVRAQGVVQFFRGVAVLARILEGDGEFVLTLPRALVVDDETRVVPEPATGIDGPVGRKPVKELLAKRAGVSRVRIQKIAEFFLGPGFLHEKTGIVLLMRFIRHAISVQRYSHVPVFKIHMVKPESIVAAIEIWGYVFPENAYFHAIECEMFLAETGIKKKIGFVRRDMNFMS